MVVVSVGDPVWVEKAQPDPTSLESVDGVVESIHEGAYARRIRAPTLAVFGHLVCAVTADTFDARTTHVRTHTARCPRVCARAQILLTALQVAAHDRCRARACAHDQAPLNVCTLAYAHIGEAKGRSVNLACWGGLL